MRLPLIHSPTHSEIRVIGDVTIHEGAVVAPGTILQAAPNCRIVIQEGVCVGMGTLINAYQGDICIESGAMLGAGVLIVGQGIIGQNACIGSSTTIINASIEPETAIEAGSLIGDTSRTFAEELSGEKQDMKSKPNGSLPDRNHSISDRNGSPSSDNKRDKEQPMIVEEVEDLWAEPETEIDETPENPPQTTPPAKPQNQTVVGQVYINQLLCTLFPERQAFNRSQNNASSDDSTKDS